MRIEISALNGLISLRLILFETDEPFLSGVLDLVEDMEGPDDERKRLRGED
jgi:hypothetical protein